jgi:hypothetical protein
MKEQYKYRIPDGFRLSGVKSIFYDFSVDLIWFCIFYPACAMVLDIGMKTPFAFAAPFILLIGMFLTTLNRKKTKRLLIFVLLLLLIAAAVTAAGPDLGGRILFGIIIGILSLCSIAKYHSLLKIKDASPDEISQEASLSDFHIGIGELCIGTAVLYLSFLVALGYHKQYISILCFIAFCCVIMIYWLYGHNADSSALLRDSKSNASSLAEFKHLGRLIIGSAVFVVILLGILSYMIYYLFGLNRIDNSMVGAFGDVFNHGFSTGNDGFQSGLLPPPPQDTPQSNSWLAVVITFLIRCLFYVIIASVMLAAVLLSLMLLSMLARTILRTFKMRKGEEVHQSVFSFKEMAEKIKVSVKSHTLFAEFSGKTNNVKVRKAYHRFVSKQIKSGAQIKKNDAPFDIKQKVKADHDLRDATEIYEKARYSDSECTDEEVTKMKDSTGK